MKSEDRTRYCMQALGWNGGTVHQLCETIGCDVNEFLYADADGVGYIGSDFSAGWFATRTCGLEFFLKEILPERMGNLQFWFGVCAGQAITDELKE